MKKRYDIIIIGAGSGLTLSHTAAEHGKKVAIVEPGPFGGTCLNRGCIPSKMLIHTADIADTITSSKNFGIHAKITSINWRKLVTRVTSIIDKDAKRIEHANRKTKNITVYKTNAEFVNKKELRVGKDIITAPKIIIAAGARPFIPPIPGLDKTPYITSTEALRLQKQPKHLVIIGGGYIGTELAHFYGSLGTKITIIDRNNQLMNAEDNDIAQQFTNAYREKHNLILNADVKSTSNSKGRISVHVVHKKKNKTITGDALLVATGRQPNTDRLNVKKAGIKTDKRGFINVNKYLETNVPGIWALGDIVGKYMFKHGANLEAQTIAHNIYGNGKKKPVDYTAMPHAAFTSPQIASVGYTEEQLKKKNITYVKARYNYINTGYGMAINDTTGFVKVLASPSGKILGCHIIGSHASILIHEVIVAMKAKLGTTGITDATHIHPALSEVVQRAFLQLE